MILKKVCVCLIFIYLTLLKEAKSEFSLRSEMKLLFPKLKEIGPRLHNFTTSLKMNMKLMKSLNRIKSKEEFQKLFGILTARSGMTPALYTSTKAAEVIDAANVGCIPVKTPVDLTVSDDDPSALYYPSCVMLEKCGGCCYGSLLSCQPEVEEDVNFKIVKVRPTSRDEKVQDNTVSEDLIVTEKRHLECSCKCTVKEENCDPETQVYNENECSCDCIDIQAEAECLIKEDTHFWESSKCSCKCKDVLECSSGFHFDHTVCRCVNSVLRANMRKLEFDGNGLNYNFY